MKRGLTFTVIAQAQSLNYGEGIGNISELKKLSRDDGNIYTFASRQYKRIRRNGFIWIYENK